MHRCLSILEIVSLVCEDLAIDSNARAGYMALVNLATTCHLMYEPSMNSLWYGLFNMVPLLRCFPEDVWEAEGPAAHVRKFELRRPLLPSDWTRFLHHAGRVRSLGATNDHSHLAITTRVEQHIAPRSAYHALEMSKPRERLLPSLRRLRWSFCEDELQYMRLFLCPSMKDISVLLHRAPSMAEQSMLVSLSSMKQITCFSIGISYRARVASMKRGDAYVAYITPILKDIISSWDRLKTLDIPLTSLTASSLAHIAKLPYLEKLTVELREPINFPCLEGPVFPVLRRLVVEHSDLSTCRNFLQLSQSWALETIDVMTEVDHSDSEETMQAFFQVLQSHVSNDNLTRVGIVSRDAPNASNNHILDIVTLAPLLLLPHLEVLEIYTHHPFSLGDPDLVKIAKAWPKLKILFLGRHGWGASSSITPKGLASLINQCVHMTMLSLAIDASAVDYQLDYVTCSRPNLDISYLNLQDSRLGDVQTMTAFLSNIMPKIHFVNAWSGRMRGHEHVSPAEADALTRKWMETERATMDHVEMQRH
ncbi:hypothetical protein FIBSPDRAFT_461086 [Athelia psychrophila]|uniref:F-box domain-containing protein n=1 Tax=Athelia psychrophila TaxID=1759441 RepID=A0A166LUE6_9AGAM|nr:hypothetical protein FIBSPDRAFT_461086 [Fibularhizoctonia sp. CBS 109695]